MVKKVVDILPKESKEKKEIEEIKIEERKKEVKEKVKKGKKTFFIFLISAVLIFGIWLSFAISKVKIEIWPRIKTLSFQEEISLDKDIQGFNLDKKVLQAQILSAEDSFSDEFLATGKTKKEEKAQGVVRIFNNYTSDQVLVQNTRLQAPLEKFKPPLEKGENPWFRTLEKVIVPAKGYVDVKVIADAPGEKYNIEPSNFSIPGLLGTPQYTLIYGKSFEPMKGGMIKEISKITKEDIETAGKKLEERSIEEMKNILKNKAIPELEFLPELVKVEILDRKPLAKEGEEKEKFSFQIKAKGTILTFKKSEIKDLLLNLATLQLKKDAEILKESLDYNLKVKDFDLEKGKAILSVECSVKFYDKIDLEKLKNSLSGRSLEEVKSFLEKEENIQKIKIKAFPFWVNKIPQNLKKLEISYPLID
jgi:hypothetical protein